MTKQSYQVTLYVDVSDPEELYKAALERAVGDGLTQESASEDLRPDGEIHVGNCLLMLLDPGRAPPGCEILGSACE